MAKPEQRPVDAGLTASRTRDGTALVEWWKERLGLIAGIPTEVARAGALIPQMRELSYLQDPERRRLTKARITAFVALPPDQRQRVMAGRKLVNAIDPELAKSDDAVVDSVVGDVPGAAEARRELES